MDDATPPARGGTQFIPRPDAWRLGQPAPWRDGAMVGSVDELIGRVAARELAREPAGDGSGFVPLFDGARHSAVLVVLHQGAEGPEVLFTKRSSSLRNHRGEISFPGGRVDPGETAVQAALREAWEEVALAPELVTVHGQLDHLATIVSNSHIVPVVATVAERPELHAHAAEVDRILWVGLDELARADTFREEWWGEPPADRPIFFFELSDETVWGATARILHQLLRLAHGLSGPEPLAW